MKLSQDMVFPEHVSEAIKDAMEEAAKGNPEGQIALGRIYEHGEGCPQNYPEALHWYMKAAESRPQAKYLIGQMYANGRGVTRDREAAIRWLTESARDGYAEAQHMLGAMYARGKGVHQNLEKAAEWFRMAAENGDDRSQLVYGLMLRDGRGVARDDVAAFVWISAAGANRPPGRERDIAMEALASVSRRLTPDQIKEAEERLLAIVPSAVSRQSVPPGDGVSRQVGSHPA